MTATGKPKTSFLTLFLRGFQWTFLKSVGGMVVRVVTLIILSATDTFRLWRRRHRNLSDRLHLSAG